VKRKPDVVGQPSGLASTGNQRMRSLLFGNEAINPGVMQHGRKENMLFYLLVYREGANVTVKQLYFINIFKAVFDSIYFVLLYEGFSESRLKY
jgi:hypothetical protein